jgi:hypothetical protein
MTAKVYFKEWLPDLPDLDHPGLAEALNTLPVVTYKSFSPLAGTDNLTLAGRPQGAILSRHGARLYAFAFDDTTATGIAGFYENTELAWTLKGGAANNAADGANFAEFDDLVIGAIGQGDGVQCITVGSTGQFTALATSGTNPQAGRVGVINRFVMAGRFANGTTTTNSYVRWSSINDPRDWPTPGSSTAVARQAGEQWLDSQFGITSSIVGGDQFGLVFQQRGINRVTYVGGNLVFQFDNYEAERGAFFLNATIQVSGLTYFVSDKGFFVTDGTTVRDIGTKKVTQTFLNEVDLTYYARMTVALDVQRNLIYWSYPTTSATNGRPNRLLIYNFAEDRWSRANQECHVLFRGGVIAGTSSDTTFPQGFLSSYTVASFSGTPGSAILTTGEAEFNAGGRSFVSGVKPLVDVTANAVTVALGTRSDQQASPSFTSEVTANSRSGFCDFRSDARYHRARLTLAGTFNACQGLEIRAVQSGSQ